MNWQLLLLFTSLSRYFMFLDFVDIILLRWRMIITLEERKIFYIYMTINLHFTSRKNKRQRKTQKTKLHDRQMPIYRKVPGNIK